MPFGTTLQTALEGEVVNPFFAVEIGHPEKTIRLLDFAGVLSFASVTWYGIDDDIGALGALEVINDQSGGDEIPEFQIVIRPVDTNTLAALSVPEAQGAGVQLIVGAYSPSTGLVVGDPEVIFYGYIDEVDTVLDAANTMVTFTCVSDFVAFQIDDEAMTLSDSFHQSVWSGEEGLEFMTDVEQQMPWGAEGARPEVVAVRSVLNRIRGRA